MAGLNRSRCAALASGLLAAVAGTPVHAEADANVPASAPQSPPVSQPKPQPPPARAARAEGTTIAVVEAMRVVADNAESPAIPICGT